jgi:hypothetical protein
MKTKISPRKILSIYLSLMSLHSLCVGLGLIIMTKSQLSQLGFMVSENFFPDQGGVFHIIMSLAYILPVINYEKFVQFVPFSVIVKFIATIFLFSYFFFVDRLLMVLISGIFDFLMGLLLLIIYRWVKNSNHLLTNIDQ